MLDRNRWLEELDTRPSDYDRFVECSKAEGRTLGEVIGECALIGLERPVVRKGQD
jgi:hypothetical protein